MKDVNERDVQGNLNWSASGSGVADITFTPSSGTLAPNASVQVEVDVPDTSYPDTNNYCKTPAAPTFATLTFVGPANTVTVAWSCPIIG